MARTYDLKNVVCTVGGIPISGYGEDDAIGWEWDSDIVEATKTADGDTIYSRLNDRGVTVTVTLSQKSLAYNLLAAAMELQHGDVVGIHPPVILPLPFALIDPSNGDSLTSGECVFVSRPAPSKGKTVGEVAFKLHLPSPKVLYGPVNTTP